ncbi:hypothetical protein [Lapidilactobacillus luobeiensis]|uniref:hypothetical protein n=1 Tax=Lapidilactobacillus luobeiensis TaxID=2950371 RepID=UPI0021C4C17E|nr:hypothetical protein [Lapidilactobacillus luobeiensis]
MVYSFACLLTSYDFKKQAISVRKMIKQPSELVIFGASAQRENSGFRPRASKISALDAAFAPASRSLRQWQHQFFYQKVPQHSGDMLW